MRSFFCQSLIIVLSLFLQDIEIIALTTSIILILDIYLNYYKNKEFNYIQLWNIGFIYIVCTEFILRSNDLQHSVFFGYQAVIFILLANFSVNIGYLIGKEKNNIKELIFNVSTKMNKPIVIMFVVLSISYFLVFMPRAIQSFNLGRLGLQEEKNTNILMTILGSVGLAFPPMITYYIRFKLKNRNKYLLFLSILMFVFPQLLFGTRFAILFSVISSLIVWFSFRKLKKSIVIFLAILGFISLVSLNYIKNNRNLGKEKGAFTILSQDNDRGFLKGLASFGSDEGIVYGTAKMMEYIDNTDYTYGISSSFPIYFWVPRIFWEDKPYQLSYWLIRKYSITEYSEVHSAAYGFWGELYMDFGYFSLLFLLLFGILLKKMDKRRAAIMKRESFEMVFYALLFPFFFLVIRSPQTAIISGIMIYLVYKMILKFTIK